MLRCLLFVPADRPERFIKAESSGADAIILDLEDSVATGAKQRAREAVCNFLSSPSANGVMRLVRINPLDSAYLSDDLACLGGADGIVLPKSEGAASVTSLKALVSPNIKLLPIATETPRAIFGLGTYSDDRDVLMGLTWGAEDLPAAMGAVSSRTHEGFYTAPYEIVRSLALFAAHAARVQAIETVYPAIRDLAGLASYAARGAHDGFSAMMALHPAQVPVINAAFTPTQAEIDDARRVLDAFSGSPDAGVLMIDGMMVDAPHVSQAQCVLARARTGKRRR